MEETKKETWIQRNRYVAISLDVKRELEQLIADFPDIKQTYFLSNIVKIGIESERARRELIGGIR